jgi:phage gpG-like protein
MPWKEVKRRQNGGKKAAATRKILTGESGDLAESIQYHKQGRNIVISAPKVYAEIHNKGLEGKAFGKYKFTMPKRQFIGPSALLMKKINKRITGRMAKIMRR